MPSETAYVALGANRGNARAQFARAARELASRPGIRVLRVSRLYRTQPVGGPRQRDFLNAVVALRVRHTPMRLLALLLEVERLLGRRRAGPRWGPRAIDLDLLAVGARQTKSRCLTLPHPRLHRRRFVLAPLADVAPNWVHPRLKRRTITLLRQLTLPDQRVTIVGKWTAPPSSPSKKRSRKNPQSSR